MTSSSEQPAAPQLSDADRAFLAQAASAESAELQAERAALAGTRDRAVQAYAQDTAGQVSEELMKLQSLAAARQITLADATPPAAVPAPPAIPDPPAPPPAKANSGKGRTASGNAPAPDAHGKDAHGKDAHGKDAHGKTVAKAPAPRPGPALPRFADKDFLATRIAAQQATLAIFRQEAETGSDPELKQCAAQFVQRTEQHLRLAQEVARRL